MKQKTIKNPITFSGVGLHTGQAVRMTLKPAQDNEGVSFTRVDLSTSKRFKSMLLMRSWMRK